MSFKDKFLDVLQNIEFPIQVVYKQHPELTDYDAVSSVESVIEFYTAEQRNRDPRNFNLSVKALKIYDGVKEACNFRLGRKPLKDNALNDELEPISVPEILKCLNTVKNSINKWTKRNGRQGYLNFVKNYMPNV